MIHSNINALETVRKLNHYDMVHRGIKAGKWCFCPFFHLFLGRFHGPAGEVKMFDKRIILFYDILPGIAFLIFSKTKTHGLAAADGFFNAFFEHLPLQIYLNRQTGTNV